MVLHLLPGAWVAWQESGAMRFYNGDHSDCEWMGKRGGERERVTVGETQKEEEEKDGERITERKEKTDGERERERDGAQAHRRLSGVRAHRLVGDQQTGRRWHLSGSESEKLI